MPRSGSRALVLGGGGVIGVAWHTGVICGLRDVGVDPTQADLIVGTSAGSIVGAQLATGAAFDELYAAQIAPRSGGVDGLLSELDAEELRNLFRKWVFAPEMTQALAAEIGAMALAAK